MPEERRSNGSHEKPAGTDTGIAGLPKRWAVAVQLVGTFGLAVFLVLYYVLVMQPKEAKRYDQLRESVATLGEIIGGQQSLITREQDDRLEELWVKAMAPEIASLVARERPGGDATALAKKIDDALILQTRLLEGLRRKDGGTVSEMLTHKILNSGISGDIAEKALGDWRDADLATLIDGCRDALLFAVRRAAMAK